MTRKLTISLSLIALTVIGGAFIFQNITKKASVASENSVDSTHISHVEKTNSSFSIQENSNDEDLQSSSEEMSYGQGELLFAVQNNNLEKVQEIVQDTHYNLDEQDDSQNTPLNLAVLYNFIDIAKVLIDHGADINLQNSINDSPFLYAGAEGRIEILAYMIANSAPDFSKVNRFGGNALIPAAEKGHIENVQMLLANYPTEVNFQNNSGYTALIEVIAFNDGSELYQNIVRELLQAGADRSIKDNFGRTALDYANLYHYQKIIDLLVS